MPVIVGSLFNKDAFINKIRIYMRDDPEQNLLLDGLETSHTMIDWAIELSVEEYNLQPPHIGDVTFDTYPSVALLHLATIINILISAGFLQSRNQLTFNDGGISLQISNKTGLYQSWIRLLMGKYESLLLRLKRAKNAASGYGGVHSEYLTASVHSYFGGDAAAGIIEQAPGLTLLF